MRVSKGRAVTFSTYCLLEGRLTHPASLRSAPLSRGEFSPFEPKKSPLESNVINLRKKECLQANAPRENACPNSDTASIQEGRFGSPALKLMTLLSRGDFFDANGNHSPLERGAEPSEAGCVSRRSSKQHLEHVTALPSKGESKRCRPKTAILSDRPLHHSFTFHGAEHQ